MPRKATFQQKSHLQAHSPQMDLLQISESENISDLFAWDGPSQVLHHITNRPQREEPRHQIKKMPFCRLQKQKKQKENKQTDRKASLCLLNRNNQHRRCITQEKQTTISLIYFKKDEALTKYDKLKASRQNNMLPERSFSTLQQSKSRTVLIHMLKIKTAKISERLKTINQNSSIHNLSSLKVRWLTKKIEQSRVKEQFSRPTEKNTGRCDTEQSKKLINSRYRFLNPKVFLKRNE